MSSLELKTFLSIQEVKLELKDQKRLYSQDPAWCLDYIIVTLGKRWPEGEKVILTDVVCIYYYTQWLKKIDPQYHWAEGQEAIIDLVRKDPTTPQNMEYLVYYSSYLKERNAEIEEMVLKHIPFFSFFYILKNLNQKYPGIRWAEGEKNILKDAEVCLLYMRLILKKRWPEGEQVILQNPDSNATILHDYLIWLRDVEPARYLELKVRYNVYIP